MSAVSAAMVDPAQPWSDPAEGARRLAMVSSSEVGIVRRTYRQLYDVDDIRVEAVGSDACESTGLLGAPCNQLNGGGHADLDAATAAALGEAVERYSASYLDPAVLTLATADELADAGVLHVPPQALSLFAPEQFADPAFAFSEFSGATEISWVAGRRLVDDAPTMLPANLVFLAPVSWGARIGYPTSNGVACHLSVTEALAGGAMELCERDAFTRVWYRRLSMPRLEVDDPGLQDWLKRYVEPTGLDLALLDLTPLTTCPTVLAVIRNNSTGVVPMALGAASAATAVAAARKAVVEGFQTRIWAKAEQREGAVLAPSVGFTDVLDFDDHVRLSLHPEAIEAARFLDAATTTTPISSISPLDAESPAALLADLAGRLREQAVDLYGIDLTSPDIDEAGLCVARAFSPQLQPLDAGWHQRFVGGARLHDLTTLGYDQAQWGPSAALNPWPHPFP